MGLQVETKRKEGKIHFWSLVEGTLGSRTAGHGAHGLHPVTGAGMQTAEEVSNSVATAALISSVVYRKMQAETAKLKGKINFKRSQQSLSLKTLSLLQTSHDTKQ